MWSITYLKIQIFKKFLYFVFQAFSLNSNHLFFLSVVCQCTCFPCLWRQPLCPHYSCPGNDSKWMNIKRIKKEKFRKKIIFAEIVSSFTVAVRDVKLFTSVTSVKSSQSWCQSTLSPDLQFLLFFSRACEICAMTWRWLKWGSYLSAVCPLFLH